MDNDYWYVNNKKSINDRIVTYKCLKERLNESIPGSRLFHLQFEELKILNPLSQLKETIMKEDEENAIAEWAQNHAEKGWRQRELAKSTGPKSVLLDSNETIMKNVKFILSNNSGNIPLNQLADRYIEFASLLPPHLEPEFNFDKDIFLVTLLWFKGSPLERQNYLVVKISPTSILLDIHENKGELCTFTSSAYANNANYYAAIKGLVSEICRYCDAQEVLRPDPDVPANGDFTNYIATGAQPIKLEEEVIPETTQEVTPDESESSSLDKLISVISNALLKYHFMPCERYNGLDINKGSRPISTNAFCFIVDACKDTFRYLDDDDIEKLLEDLLIIPLKSNHIEINFANFPFHFEKDESICLSTKIEYADAHDLSCDRPSVYFSLHEVDGVFGEIDGAVSNRLAESFSSEKRSSSAIWIAFIKLYLDSRAKLIEKVKSNSPE